MTSGPPAKLIFLFGLPLLAGNILQQLYNFVDTIIVGRGISMEALAAVGVTGSLNFLVLGFLMGLSQGVSILVSQFFGAEDFASLRKSITMSAWLCFGAGFIIMTLALSGSRWLLEVIITPPDIIDDAQTYLNLIFMGIPLSLAYNFLGGILRGVGDSKNPLIAMVIAFSINTALDLLFILPLKMGVAGAALATVLAQGISALYCLWCCLKIDVLKLHRSDWKWSGSLFRRSYRLSLPVAFMNSITAVGLIFLAAAINGYGSDFVAAYSAASKVLVILEQISSAFGMAASSYAGQNMGAGKISRIRTGIRKANLIVLALNLICTICMFAFSRNLLQIMVSAENREVLDISVYILNFQSAFLAFLGTLWVFRSALQGMGDTVAAMLSGLVEFFTRIFCILWLPALLGFNGVLSAETFSWITATILLAAIYYRKLSKLKKKEPIKTESVHLE